MKIKRLKQKTNNTEFKPDFKIQKRLEHGGSVTLGRRRKRRPLSVRRPHHLVLRSDYAYGPRSLLRHRPRINKIIAKAKKRFSVKVYEFAVVSNHIHILVRGSSRTGLQNFFRVVAGHIAQEILREFPITNKDKPRGGGAHQVNKFGINSKLRERENKFWQMRIYSRVMRWGREFLTVKSYVIQNTLEALGIIPYQIRGVRSQHPVLLSLMKKFSGRSRSGGGAPRWADTS